ncbi:hypothetical protein [Burkholderia cepacia]|uniref:hypothetical protein n=1 Tax=Burkholderia cepacia TaxID=292 RepID=UPI002018B125|nr:hypothetical protein [Burkholderia cepacia]UQO32620.1 hypothetical protein L0Z22_08720 [Burkholderia cepacia]UQO46115.1 hypothetical protein L0Z05_10520 [Burkholderia cepacia]UQP11195.1 hypothetical protein L0Z01_24270 [Burkholderia cepacia]
MKKTLSKIAKTSMESVISSLFLKRIRELATQDKQFLKNVPGFLINPKSITVYWFDEHFAISFEGNDREKSLDERRNPDFYHREHFSEHKKTYAFSAVTGVDLKKSSEEGYLPAMVALSIISGKISGRGFLFSESTLTDLLGLGWRIETLNTTGMIVGFNEYAIPRKESFNFQNIFIFQKIDGKGVTSHHVKWLEIIPYQLGFDSNGEINDIQGSPSILEKAANDAGFKEFFIPKSYEQIKFHAINRFIELWGYASTKETTITRFLGDDRHKFLLSMNFGARALYSEVTCLKCDSSGEAVRPDFFIEKANGLCDIVEFKLPRVTKPMVVGAKNRRRFASWLGAHLAQANAYRRHFLDARHRMDMKKKYGIEIEIPMITIIIGRRSDITAEVRMLLTDYPGINIMSYDELVDGVVAQLYM